LLIAFPVSFSCCLVSRGLRVALHAAAAKGVALRRVGQATGTGGPECRVGPARGLFDFGQSVLALAELNGPQ
jgi:hypothetical protein